MNEMKVNQRAKKLGVLIQDARLHADRSVAECAQVVSLTLEQYERVEAGEHLISLPDLEALAIYLDVPMGHFWGSETLEDQEVDYQQMIALRHRVIGVLMRQLRLKARKKTAEVTEAVGLEPDQLEAYEAGEEPVPYVVLEQICRYLNGSVDFFVDAEHGPLGRHEAEYRLRKQFREMDPEMQTFLANPINVTYLETAKKLSEMDVDKLRQVAENILEITF